VSGVTLAAAAASATLSIHAASLALGTLGGTGRSPLGVCTAVRPVGCDARRRSFVGNALDQRRFAAAAASATLSIKAAALALGGLGGTGRSLLGVCTADRPVGCGARRRSCVGNTLDQCRFAAPQLRRQRSRSKLLLSPSEAWAAQAARCSVSAPLIALSGVTLAAAVPSATLSINAAALAPRCSVSAPLIALSDVKLTDAAASATLSINAAFLSLGSMGGTGRSLLGVCTADRPVGCGARRRSCGGNTLDQCRFAAPQLRRQRSRSKLLLSPSEAWAAQAARCSVSAPLIALSGVTLAAAAASATLSINAAALAPRCSVSAPLIALSDVKLTDAAASATLSINAASPPQLRRQQSRSMPLRRAAAASATLPIKAAALTLGGLGGTGRSLLGVCTADRPVGCDARRRSCVGHALDQRCCPRSRRLGRHRPLAARCLHR